MSDVADLYKDKLRVRSCGVLVENGKLLLVQLHSPVIDELIWTLPGGGVEAGERLDETLRREFLEETGINVKVGRLVRLRELIMNQFHALEYYFLVEKMSGSLITGTDPELNEDQQIIKKTAYLSASEMKHLKVLPEYFKDSFWTDLETGDFDPASGLV